MKAKIMSLIAATAVLMIGTIGSAFAQEELPEEAIDIAFNFTAAEAVILVIGILGGLTTAYLGYRKARRADENLRFNITKFLDRVIIAVIASVGLAITSAIGIVELNLVTMFLIFTSSLGTSELVLEFNALRGK